MSWSSSTWRVASINGEWSALETMGQGHLPPAGGGHARLSYMMTGTMCHDLKSLFVVQN